MPETFKNGHDPPLTSDTAADPFSNLSPLTPFFPTSLLYL